MRQRRQKKISEIVAAESAPRVETILKKSAQQRFVGRERDHAVADIAGRQDSILAAQAAGASTVVGNGDDRGEIADGTFRGRRWIVARNDVMF